MLNWGIIGCGVIAPAHAEAITEAGDKVRLHSVCDIVEEKAQKLAKDFKAQKIYTDYREMLKDPTLDVVSICTPSGMHGEMVIKAARAGKHIL